MISNRVQIPAYTDHWMKGDRFGTIIKTSRSKDCVTVLHVLLDKSGKTVKVISDDCGDV